HLAWAVALGAQAQATYRGPAQEAWLERLEREHANIRAALTWSLHDAERATLGVRVASTIWPFWWLHSHLSEGRHWLEAVLAATPGAPAVRARALTGAGQLATFQGDTPRAIAAHQEALTLYDPEDTAGRALTLHFLAHAFIEQADYAQASPCA